jgi:hypothetical protein
LLYSPIKVALAGIAVWCFLWLILPLQEVGYLSWEALIYVALCYAALFLGTFLGGRSIERLPPERWDRPFSPALFWTSLGIGLVGAAMRLFDRAVLRGVEYGADALAFRETLETADVGIIGAIGAAIYSFCLLPMVILMVTKRVSHPDGRELSAALADVHARHDRLGFRRGGDRTIQRQSRPPPSFADWCGCSNGDEHGINRHLLDAPGIV